MTLVDAAEAVGRTFKATQARAYTNNLAFMPARRNLRKQQQSVKLRPPEKKSISLYEKTQRDRLMRASIQHLIDLKRAGHSPTRTELHLMPIHVEAAQ